MAIYFAEACISENGGINGQKGDQANEIRLSTPYNHSLGWRKFRCPDKNLAKWIGINARVIAQNQNFGYGQNDRVTGYNASKSVGWEPALVNTPCNLDCSEMVRTEIACAMERDISDFHTGNEADVLISLGFKEITDGSMQHGDIWVTRTKGHTITVVDTNITAQSSNATVNAVTSKSAPDIIYKAKTKNHGWLPEVVNNTDYAGIEGDPFVAFACKRADKGAIKYRCSTTATNGFLPYVTGYDVNDFNNGYCGDGVTPLDEIEIHADGYTYFYKTSPLNSTSYYAEVSDDTMSGSESYAGANGQIIDKIQIRKG